MKDRDVWVWDGKAKVEAEWGGNVNWLDPKFVTVHDSEGNEIKSKCKCGKKATFFAIGKEAYAGFCGDCYDKGTKRNE